MKARKLNLRFYIPNTFVQIRNALCSERQATNELQELRLQNNACENQITNELQELRFKRMQRGETCASKLSKTDVIIFSTNAIALQNIMLGTHVEVMRMEQKRHAQRRICKGRDKSL